MTAKSRVSDMRVGYKGPAVPWAMFVDEEHRFWLNCNYTVYGEKGERTWSPHGGYSDPFAPLPVLNLRSREPALAPFRGDAPL